VAEGGSGVERVAGLSQIFLYQPLRHRVGENEADSIPLAPVSSRTLS
jgi:hypothetical protein